jgi:hypothetical protein
MTEELILLPGDNTFIGSIDNLKKINDNVWLFINEYIDNNSTKYNWTLIDHKNNRFIDGSTTDKSGNRIISNGSAKKIEILYDRYLWIMNIENQGVGSYECKYMTYRHANWFFISIQVIMILKKIRAARFTYYKIV